MAMKILIADDDADIRRTLEIGFHRLGYEVHLVEDALRAFTHAQKAMPDAILLDINMPPRQRLGRVESAEGFAGHATHPGGRH